jgi:DNA-binding IclR family transcriptional regulator
VPAVEKVFVILEALARSQGGITVRELAAVCGLPKSSVHCIVTTLQRSAYLHRNPRTGRYLFGRKLLMFANQALSGLELGELAEPYLLSLARMTRLEVHLGIVERDEVVLVAKLDVARPSRAAGSWVGRRMELHCTALGKCLISRWDESELARLARERTLARHNDNTIASLRKLSEEVMRVRRAGYAVDDEEHLLGTRCVGAPVYGSDGAVIAALSVSGNTMQIDAENVTHIAEFVMADACAFSRSLGYERRQASGVPAA